MNPASIVKHFDVIEYAQTRLFSCFKFLMMNKFILQRSEEAFSDGIVKAVTFFAHALFAGVFFEFIAKLLAGVLAAPIRMHYIWCLMLLAEKRHAESVHNDVCGHP